MPCTSAFGEASKGWTYARLEKCEFEVEFLSYVISGNGIHMDPRKV
jgi:hypothetical protein